MTQGAVPGAVASETEILPPQLPLLISRPSLLPGVSSTGDQHVLTSSRMQDLRRSLSSLVREAWPWSLSARERKRLGGEGSTA